MSRQFPRPEVSLQQIAQEAGVSAMTVSRVLRGSPKVAETTRAQVLTAAHDLGYRPDPHWARMMQLVRGRKASRTRAVLAVIREGAAQNHLDDPAYQYVRLEDIQRRAEQHGYLVEEFWLGRDGLTPKKLVKILRARAIEGVIISPQSSRLLCAELDYAPFASVTFGYGLRQPSLHRCAGNMTLGVRLATEELKLRGYRRIGLAITQWVDTRAEGAYTGALLHYQEQIPAKDRVPLLLLPHNDIRRGEVAFSAWMRQHGPDALITFALHVPEWLSRLGLQAPQHLGLVSHDWAPEMKGIAGIHHRRDHVAAAAVDLLATQLLQHEFGVPEVPRQILIPPVWVDGDSVRGRVG